MERHSVSNAIVLEILRHNNYATWSVCVKSYLLAQDLWDIIEVATEPPKIEEAEEEYKVWRKKNAAALHAIQISCEPEILLQILEISSAKDAWNTLARMHEAKSLEKGEGEEVEVEERQKGDEEKDEEEKGVSEVSDSLSQGVDSVNVPQPQGINTDSNGGNISLPQPINESNLLLQPTKVNRIRSLTRVKYSKPKSRFCEIQFDEEENLKEKAEGKVVEKNGEEIQRSFTARSPKSFKYYDDVEFQPLIRAINKGNLDDAMSFIDLYPDAKNARIIADGSTALHVASNAGQVKIVEKLVGLLSEKDLEMQDQIGSTALTIAARNGVIEIAECLIKKNKNLLGIMNSRGYIPVVSAAQRRHKNMTRYLYSKTRDELDFIDRQNGSMLLICCIIGKILDVALDLISYWSQLTTYKGGSGSSPIRALSRMASIFPSGSELPFWKRLIYSCIHVQLPYSFEEFRVDIPHDGENEQKNIIVQGMKKLHDMKLMHLQALEILRHICERISTLEMSESESEVRDSFFRAVQYGTVEFVVEMSKANPQLLYIKDKNARGIFQYAVEFRQEKIFSLLYGLDARRDSLVTIIDKTDNTISHLAGLLAPSSQLARISGAPLQMQRELQWYKEVKSIVGSMHEGYFNKNKETPNEVFSKSHKQLVKEGEEWMKQTAESSTVVGALIITIMFAAAFTLPGGNDQNTGYPMFLHKKVFTIFIVSDAVSLFFSSTSVLMFLAILTSRYAEEDFLKSLPTKLIIGLSTLFISIASMMIAFCAALVLMLKGKLSIITPLVSLACIPIAFFIQLQFPLLVDIFMSTYGPSIFDRKMKSWL